MALIVFKKLSRSKLVVVIEVASVIELSEASGRVAAGLFMTDQIHSPTIDTLVTGMSRSRRMESSGAAWT